MQLAVSMDDAPAPVEGTSFDPYGQIVKMLMPRAQAIAIYDRMGLPLWLNGGVDAPELHRLMQQALAGELRPGRGQDGFAELVDRDHSAYAFMLRDAEGELVGAVGMVFRNPGHKAVAQPFAMVQSLLRPALECLRRELAAQCSIGALQRSLSLRDRDLELLLGAAPGDSEGDSADDLAQLVQGCVDHLGCAVGALLVPDKNIAVCRTGPGTPPREGAAVLTRAHRPLLAWTQLHRRSLLSNRPVETGAIGPLPYKLLSCPVMHGAQQVPGLLALFKPPHASDFDLRQVRIVELLARRVAWILMNAYDPSTGLLTRPAFEKRSQALIEQSPGGGHCVIYVDIDRMHVLNENLGMHVGDEVIVRVAGVVRHSLAPRMLAARISGDRCAVFLACTTTAAAESIAEGMRSAIARLGCLASGRPVEVSASFGVARIAEGERSLAHALAAAEIACKAAKDRGRDRVEVYEESDQSILRRHADVTLVGTLGRALAEDRFRLEAQAIVPLNGLAPGPKYELLLRMTDESGQSIAPDRFLSAAERYQLAPAIDRWVVLRVLSLLGERSAVLASRRICFAVNISGQSLGDPEFCTFLEDALRRSTVPATLLSFELTETAAVANIVRAETLVRRIRELGHDVALDDFGRGLSSLSYLKALSVTCLKIDGSLVRDVVGDERSQAMLSAIVRLAGAMGLVTVAECVESDEIRRIIRGLGVSYGQGFAIGRPLPIDQVLKSVLGGTI
jgi:diguanylate cyclase (GGDEF)-like protein